MSKTPTPQQDAYLKRVLGRDRTKKDSKITGQYLEYDRRRGKIQAEVDKIPQGHPMLGSLATDLADAKLKADAGGFAGAYKDLKAVKQRARNASRNYFAGLPAEIATGIDDLSQGIDVIRREHQDVQDAMGVLCDDIAAEEKVEDCADLDDAYERRAELTNDQALWQGRIDSAATQVKSTAGKANNLGVKAKVESLGRLIDVLRQNTAQDAKADQAKANSLAVDLAKVDMTTRLGGEYISGAVITRLFDDRRHQAEGLIAAALAFGDLQQRAPEPALAKFKALDDRDTKRIVYAKQQLKRAAYRDAAPKTLGGAGPSARVNKYDPETFDVSDVIAADTLAGLGDNAIDDPLINGEAAAAANKLQVAMTGLPPGSDQMFNLALKSQADLELEIMKELNWTRNDLKNAPNRVKLVQEVAKSLHETAIANNPNKMADDGSGVTIGGVAYGNKEYLAQGGFGKIHRYTDPLTNETIVVKSMNVPKKRDEMVQEMQAHRQAMGGENGVPHPNIVQMKGAAVSDDGTLHMILEEAKGGDVNSFIKSVQAASNSGLLSPEASAALTRRTMKQALEGVKVLHEQGLLHLDIKAENFLMDEDGTVKLADFGSAQAPANDTGKVASREVTTTEEYAPPELRDGERAVDSKGEVFWLGAMLQGAGSSIGIEGEAQRPENRVGQHEQFDVLRTGHGATAFDRLRDAMLNPDPKKRPTLDGVLLSAYMADQAQSFEEDDVDALAQAVVDYSGAVGRKVRDIEKDINGNLGDLKKQEPKFADNEPEISRRAKNEEYEKQRAAIMAEIAPLQAKLEAFTKVRSDTEMADLDADLLALRKEHVDVSSGAKPGDAAALAKQVAELDEKITTIKQVQPMLRAIAGAEAKLRTSETGEFPGGSGVKKRGEAFEAEEDEGEDDKLERETAANTRQNTFRDGPEAQDLNEEVRRARGSPQRAARQAREERANS